MANYGLLRFNTYTSRIYPISPATYDSVDLYFSALVSSAEQEILNLGCIKFTIEWQNYVAPSYPITEVREYMMIGGGWVQVRNQRYYAKHIVGDYSQVGGGDSMEVLQIGNYATINAELERLTNYSINRPFYYNPDLVWDEETTAWITNDARGGGRYQGQIVVVSDQGYVYFGEV